MDELLIRLVEAGDLYDANGAWDFRDPTGEAHTLRFQASQMLEHRRWSIDHLFVVRDHRDKLWGTVYMVPATEQQEGQDRWAFTRMVEGDEYVVFTPVEEYEVVETWYRQKQASE